MRCKTCNKDYHYCSSCGVDWSDPWMQYSFCSQSCFESFLQIKADTEEVTRIMVDFLISERGLLLDSVQAYIKERKSVLGKALIDYILKNI